MDKYKYAIKKNNISQTIPHSIILYMIQKHLKETILCLILKLSTVVTGYF